MMRIGSLVFSRDRLDARTFACIQPAPRPSKMSSLLLKLFAVALLSLATSSSAFAGRSHHISVRPLAMAGSSSDSGLAPKKVAVVGTTGRLGRQAIIELNNKNIPTKALIRKPVDIADTSITPSIAKDATGAQVAAYLAALPNVELVLGDINDQTSLETLVKDCTAVLALHGARPTGLKSLCPPLNPETDPNHARSINYVGVQNLMDACIKSKTCKRIVRITGKGEDPFGIFSILINMLGSMAKAWNYEGEQLLRKCKDIDYTIVRPGVMGPENIPTGKVLALADNGGDMKVSAVRYEDIASLCVQSLDYENCARTTLTAMNVEEGEGEETYAPLLAKVKADSREFPETLLSEHKKAARLGATVLVGFLAILVKAVILPLGNFVAGGIMSLSK